MVAMIFLIAQKIFFFQSERKKKNKCVKVHKPNSPTVRTNFFFPSILGRVSTLHIYPYARGYTCITKFLDTSREKKKKKKDVCLHESTLTCS